MRGQSYIGAAVLIASASLLCGCPQLPTGDRTDDEGSPPVLREEVSYGFDVQPIFDKRCVYCHRDRGLSELFGVPLRLTSGQARAGLIDQPSSLDPRHVLVIPEDPDNSLLYRKVASNNPPTGCRMPLLDEPLQEDEIEIVRRWIAQGARP